MPQRIKVALSLLLLTVVAVTFTLVGVIDMNEQRPTLIRILEQATGHPVKLRAIALAPAHGFTLALDGLEIGDSDAPPLLRVDRAYLGVTPGFLFGSDLRISSLRLEAPTIVITLHKTQQLLKQAQDVTIDKDRRLNELIGEGLAQLHIGRIEVDEGLITVVDRKHPEHPLLQLDHFQAEILGIAPSKSSPFSGVARFNAIPFTFSGQIGPLPGSLDLQDMPVLMRMEAKSPHIHTLLSAFPMVSLKVNAERITVSTLFNGALRSGMQSNSWLEATGMVLRDPLTNEPWPAMDLALRQKSELKLVKGIPEWHIHELFAYENGAPILKASGLMRMDIGRYVKLELNTLKGVDPAWLGQINPEWQKARGAVEGNVRVEGGMRGALRMRAQLDLTQTELRWLPHLDKKAGVPLAVNALWTSTSQDHTLETLTLSNPTDAAQVVELHGTIFPNLDIALKGEWNAESFPLFWPTSQSWHMKGLVRGEAQIQRNPGESLLASGQLTLPELRLGDLLFKDLSTPFHLERRLLWLSKLGATLGDGVVDGALVAELGGERSYMGHFTMAGVQLGAIGGPEGQNATELRPLVGGLLSGYKHPELSPPLVDGLLSGYGRFMGLLEPGLTPSRKRVVQATLVVAPGRVNLIDGALFSQAVFPDGRQPLSVPGKSLPFERGEARMTLLDRKLLLHDLQIDAHGVQIHGTGERLPGGTLSLDLSLSAPWWGQREPVSALVTGKSQELVLIPVGSRE